jgi:hypothetical protein
MKHPSKDEWVPYVFGEARPEDARRLAAHLESCADCAAEVAGWRRSLQTLDEWELPAPARSRAVIAPVFRWAVAAAIMLAAGVAIGRMTVPDAQAMRAQIESSVKAAVTLELQQKLADAEIRLASESQEESRQLWRAFSETLAAAREEDRQETASFLEEHGRQEQARYVNLRRDLETLALQADQEIREANFKLTQLTSNVP